MCLLSIIIPAYNAFESIDKSMDSILSIIPNDGSVEIIAINDGSKDCTLEILKKYSSSSPFIKIENQKNSGVSAARNNGLAIAKGKYIYFMDADDTISTSFFTTLMPYLHVGISDLLVFGFKLLKTKKKVEYFPHTYGLPLAESYLKGYTRIAVWTIVASKSLYHNNHIYFDAKTYYAEDIEVITKLMLRANKITIIPKILYNYDTTILTSAMNKKYSPKRFTSLLALQRIIEYTTAIECKNSIKKAAYNRWITDYWFQLKLNSSSSDIAFDYLFEPVSYIKNLMPKFQLTKFYLFNLLKYLQNRLKNSN